MTLNNMDKELLKTMGRACIDYRMVEENDTLLVAVSGGKDSVSLLDLLRINQTVRIFPVHYSLAVFHLSIVENDQYQIIESYCREHDIPFYHKESKLIDFVVKQKQNPCYLCSQIRRKWIFDQADELGISKIVFGHTKDDITTTSLMNIFYHRTCASQLPKLSILNDKFTLIRPLAYIEEKYLESYVHRHRLPVFKQHCTIGDNKRRKYVQNLIDEIQEDIPHIKDNIFAAFRNPSRDFFLDKGFSPPDHKGKKYRP